MCNADIAKGERFQKDVYEALRAGPGWEKTLFLIVYDDSGGQCKYTGVLPYMYVYIARSLLSLPLQQQRCTVWHPLYCTVFLCLCLSFSSPRFRP